MPEALRLLSAVVSLLGLGLVMGTSPSTYALVLRLLTRAARPAVAVRWLMLGIGLGTTVLLLVFRVIDPATITAAITDRAEKLLVMKGVDLAAGLVFALLALTQARRLRHPRPAPAAPTGPLVEQPRHLVMLGAANAIIGVSGMATMYVTGRVIASTSHDLLLEALLFALFLVAVVGPYLLLAWAWGRFKPFAQRITGIYDRLTRIDPRPLLVAGLALASLAFFALGIWGHGDLGELISRVRA